MQAYEILLKELPNHGSYNYPVDTLREWIKDASDFEQYTDDESLRELANDCKDSIEQKQLDKLKKASEELYRSINRGQEDLVVRALTNHPHLMQMMFFALGKSIMLACRYRSGEYDGRIPKCIVNFLEEYIPFKDKERFTR